MRTCYILFICLFVAALPLTHAAQTTNDIPVTTSSKEALESFHKGLHYLDVGKALEARSEFLRAVEKDPGFAHAYFYLSFAALSPEEFKQTLDKGLKAVQGKSEGEKLLMETGQTFLDNDATKRLQIARTLTAKYPNGPRAWMRLGFAEAALNHHEAARSAFTKALQLDSSLAGAHYAIGFSYLFNDPKDFDRAEQHMQEILKLDPAEAKAYEGLGDVYRAKNKLEKARDAYSKALEKDPQLSVASLKKGHINSFLGNFNEARADYDKGIEGAEKVNRINFANFKAFTYVHEGQPKSALGELQKLVESADSLGLTKDQANATKTATLTNAITIALHHKMFDDAQRILEQMKALSKETNKVVGDADFARQADAALLLLDGQLAARKEAFDAARKLAEENRKMLEKDTNPRKLEGYYGLLGLIELLQGNHAKAVEQLQKADLTNIYVQYQLALAQEGVGNKQEAKKIFRDVSRWNFNAVGFALVRKDAMNRGA